MAADIQAASWLWLLLLWLLVMLLESGGCPIECRQGVGLVQCERHVGQGGAGERARAHLRGARLHMCRHLERQL